MKYVRTYGVVVGSVAAAALIRWLVYPHIEVAPSIVFLAAVAVSAWYGGVAPGLTAAALSVLTFEFLFHHSQHFENVTSWSVWTILFVAVCLMVSYFEAKLRHALDQVEVANRSLRDTLEHVRRLESLLPICAGCKRIRNAVGEWLPVERYLHDNAGTNFTHGLCPVCLQKYVSEDAGTAA